MTQRIDRQGMFMGRVLDYGVKTAKSGAVAITVHVEIDDALIGDDWEDWREFEFDAFGDLWVVGKQGQALEWSVRDLAKWAGWDGDLESVAKGTWSPADPVCFHIQPNEYEGVVRYRLARFVDPEKPDGGSVSGLDLEEVKPLAAAFGPALRAIAADMVADTAAVRPKPAKRKKASKKPPVPATVPPDDGGPGDDETPF
jgi:hypothetical protein